MTYQRLAYDDQDTALKMRLDCTACVAAMGPPVVITPDVMEQVPALEFEALPREVRKPEITVSDATAHLASRLHLHLD